MTNDEAPTNAAGDYLRAARRAAKLTQPELADRSGVAVRTISLLETGRSTSTRANTLIKLAHALDIEEDGLIRAFGGGATPTTLTPNRAHRDHDATTIPVPVDALTAAFSAITTLLNNSDNADARHNIADAAGQLFTAYAIALLERAAANDATQKTYLAGLIRMQASAFPDTSDDRRYLTWLLDDLTEITEQDHNRYQARWTAATS